MASVKRLSDGDTVTTMINVYIPDTIGNACIWMWAYNRFRAVDSVMFRMLIPPKKAISNVVSLYDCACCIPNNIPFSNSSLFS